MVKEHSRYETISEVLLSEIYFLIDPEKIYRTILVKFTSLLSPQIV